MLLKWCRSFARAEQGAVAVVFGFSFTLIVIAAGIAIDYGRAHSIRQEMQTTLDAAVFSAAKAHVLHNADVQQSVTDFVNASDLSSEAFTIDTLTAAPDGTGAVVGTMIGRMPTYLMGVAGYQSLDLNVRSAVSFGNSKLNLVLVLDSTSSMSGTKLTALKTAAGNLVSTLHSMPGASETIKIGVVPFANYVNVGLANRNQSWISVPLEYTDVGGACHTTRPVLTRTGCRMETGTMTNDGVTSTYEYEVCDSYTYGPETTTCSDVNHVWRGCVGSRNYPLNVQDDSYTTKIPGLLNVHCSNELTPLSATPSTVTDAINAISASGDTYIPAGLAWGWRVVSNREPFAEGVTTSSEPDAKKYIVLMSDGANTKSPIYPDHKGSDVPTANSLTTELCSNIKADGIEIFTIAFSVTDTTIRNLLQSCASPGGAYYEAINASELDAAFRSIGDSLTKIRLTE